MFVCGCPDHYWTWCRCNLPADVSKLSTDDLQTALYFQAGGGWTVDSDRQEGGQKYYYYFLNLLCMRQTNMSFVYVSLCCPSTLIYLCILQLTIKICPTLDTLVSRNIMTDC